MKQWKRWMCVAMVGMAMACGDYDDDTKISELEDEQVTDLCAEFCAGESWEYTCEADGQQVSISNNTSGDCAAKCAQIKSVKDSCTLTVGDLRTMRKKPSNCAEAQASVAIVAKLIACF
jgi:hypothetical protein